MDLKTRLDEIALALAKEHVLAHGDLTETVFYEDIHRALDEAVSACIAALWSPSFIKAMDECPHGPEGTKPTKEYGRCPWHDEHVRLSMMRSALGGKP